MNWIDNAVFYHIYPLGFCGAPHQNDFSEPVSRILKVIDWIPHLKNLNINTIYFGPIFESSEHGYDTADYTKIDSRLGTNEDFKIVCDKLHENGIKIVLDGVFNHVGRNFWAFRDIQEKGQNSQYCSWFDNLNFGGNSPMGDPFWYEGWEGHYNLVKLNLRNHDVVNHIFNAISGWIDEFDIDGLRLDVAYCIDFDFLRNLKNFTKSKKHDFWLLGEVVHGDYSRWVNDEMLDSVTNYECYKGLYSSLNDKNYFEIAHSINRLLGNGGIVQNAKLYNFVDNHDVDRVASKLNDEKHLYNLYTMLFTMPGCPSIYYGSEWGIKATKDGYDHALRPCLDIMPENKLSNHIKKLAYAKQNSHALMHGKYEPIVLKNKEFAFKRVSDNDVAYILLNIEDSDVYFNLNANCTLYDVITGDELDGNNVNVSPYMSRVLTTSPLLYKSDDNDVSSYTLVITQVVMHNDNFDMTITITNNKSLDEKRVYRCKEVRKFDQPINLSARDIIDIDISNDTLLAKTADSQLEIICNSIEIL